MSVAVLFSRDPHHHWWHTHERVLSYRPATLCVTSIYNPAPMLGNMNPSGLANVMHPTHKSKPGKNRLWSPLQQKTQRTVALVLPWVCAGQISCFIWELCTVHEFCLSAGKQESWDGAWRVAGPGLSPGPKCYGHMALVSHPFCFLPCKWESSSASLATVNWEDVCKVPT